MKLPLLPLLFTTLSSAANTLCGPDEAILILDNNTTTTIKKADIAAYLPNVSFLPPNTTYPPLINTTTTPSNHTKRSSSTELIIELPSLSFLGWDIAMSTVTHANQADATIAIAAGQMLADSIAIGESADLTLVKDFLSTSYSLTYTHTVTSTLTGTVTMTIPANKWGAIVSNPLTHRKRGYVFTGEPGNGQFEYYQADSFESASYSYSAGTLAWVKGVVTTCLGDGYPLPRCEGSGVLE
ncbi:uncharacterized protein BO80DRAFT_461276 [Aspergillus ibericus CBS 121593]|uniref:Uncharacterized protein n=1 Tax=Aspergillus ibericus CBS 121593 TaxID=1448316 RepID=A0A395HBX7_9EURO|nr:hypothetical protein BO80DRAFT_461276 [Aspergillus ibericus CBS 121593]RAL05417.1 hypothetical protein BO80DRAFT_461276 [Aspergillus ibericus CBS 121593]